MAEEVAAAEGDQRERRRDHRCERPAALREQRELQDLGLGGLSRGRLERRRQVGRRAGLDQQVVRATQPRLLLGRQAARVDEVVEVGHSSSSPRTSESRVSAARVRVFTVPSGMPRNSATSLWLSPLQ